MRQQENWEHSLDATHTPRHRGLLDWPPRVMEREVALREVLEGH